jgi:hypothetical protein
MQTCTLTEHRRQGEHWWYSYEGERPQGRPPRLPTRMIAHVTIDEDIRGAKKPPLLPALASNRGTRRQTKAGGAAAVRVAQVPRLKLVKARPNEGAQSERESRRRNERLEALEPRWEVGQTICGGVTIWSGGVGPPKLQLQNIALAGSPSCQHGAHTYQTTSPASRMRTPGMCHPIRLNTALHTHRSSRKFHVSFLALTLHS